MRVAGFFESVEAARRAIEEAFGRPLPPEAVEALNKKRCLLWFRSPEYTIKLVCKREVGGIWVAFEKWGFSLERKKVEIEEGLPVIWELGWREFANEPRLRERLEALCERFLRTKGIVACKGLIREYDPELNVAVIDTRNERLLASEYGCFTINNACTWSAREIVAFLLPFHVGVFKPMEEITKEDVLALFASLVARKLAGR